MGAAQRNPSIRTQAQAAGLQGSACARPRMMGYGRAAFTLPTAGCASGDTPFGRIASTGPARVLGCVAAALHPQSPPVTMR
jgi:hypothetical protein